MHSNPTHTTRKTPFKLHMIEISENDIPTPLGQQEIFPRGPKK